MMSTEEGRDFSELICHGRSDRCFTVEGREMPICARCFGFYTGMLVGFLVSFLISQFWRPSYSALFLYTLILLIPFGVDGLLQRLTSWESRNWIRAVTGGGVGVMLGVDIFFIVF